MYYKIINKESEAYQKLHKMRADELLWEEENKTAITDKAGSDWNAYLGHGGQQNFCRVTRYTGFAFNEPEKLDPKVWKRHKGHDNIFVPNSRTKVGREMDAFITNGLKGGRFDTPLDILGLEAHGRFTFPYVEIAGDALVLYLDDSMEPQDEHLVEITKKEFQELLKK